MTKRYEMDLERLFPGKANERLRNDFLQLRSAGEQMKYMGHAIAESFATNRAMEGDRQITIWKSILLRDIFDAMAWLNRLNSLFAETVGDLYIHFRQVEREVFGDRDSEKGRSPIIELSDKLAQMEMFERSDDERSEGGEPVREEPGGRGESSAGAGRGPTTPVVRAAPPGEARLVDGIGHEERNIAADAARILGQ